MSLYEAGKFVKERAEAPRRILERSVVSLQLWLSFAAASAAVVAIPGPTVFLIVTHAASQGYRIAVPMIVGSALGGTVAMTLAMAGLGALLMSSALLLTILKLVGAAYFICIGIKMWRADPGGMKKVVAESQTSAWKAFCHAFAVTALNPKGIAFFLLFLPAFVDSQAPYVPQALILISTMVMIGIINDGLYAAFALQLRRQVQRTSMVRRINKAGEVILVSLGIVTAVHRSG
nr:LysE family translocator [Bradyrhizobium jicamae]